MTIGGVQQSNSSLTTHFAPYNMGRDILFVMMWVGAWGTIELFIQQLSTNMRIQIVLYVCVFLGGFIPLLFVAEKPDESSENAHGQKHQPLEKMSVV